MKALMPLTCCRGERTPVVGSEAERVRGITITPVALGSNDSSPRGTAISKRSVLPDRANPRSWSRNCPNS